MPLIRPETRECTGKMLTTTLSPAELELLNSIVVNRSNIVTAVELLWVMVLDD